MDEIQKLIEIRRGYQWRIKRINRDLKNLRQEQHIQQLKKEERENQ